MKVIIAVALMIAISDGRSRSRELRPVIVAGSSMQYFR